MDTKCEKNKSEEKKMSILKWLKSGVFGYHMFSATNVRPS